MAPQKFPTMRHKPRPATRLASFRDDTGLIAFRYEQTKQAEPPIPIPPPRNPLRTTRPITIVPPPVAPPREDHPLFRVQPSPKSPTDDWKRDSGLAPTSSSVTLRDDYVYGEDAVYQKILDDIADAPSIYSTDDLPSPVVDLPNPVPAPLRLSTIPRRPASPKPAVEPPVAAAPAAEPRQSLPPSPEESPVSSPTISQSQTPPLSPSPTRASSLTRKLGKTFSIRSAGNRRLRKKTMSEDMDQDQVPPGSSSSTMLRGSTSPKLPKSRTPPRSARSPNAKGADAARESQAMDSDFTPITTSIPEDSLWDDFNDLSFSKRGSIMFGSKADPLAQFMARPAPAPAPGTVARPADATDGPADAPRAESGATTTATATSTTTLPNSDDAASTRPRKPVSEDTPVPSIRVVSMDVERESQKFAASVRSSIRYSLRKRPSSHAYCAYTYASVNQFVLTSAR